MKKILIINVLSLFLFTSICYAQAPTENSPEQQVQSTADKVINKNSFLAGLGYGIETGLLGLQYRRLFTENMSVHLSGFIDFLGLGWGYGGAYQTDPKAEKCFWFINCQQRLRFSVGYLQYGGAERDLSTGGETECEDGFCFSYGGKDGATYDISSSSAFTGSVGFQSQYGRSYFYELQIGYWVPSTKATFKYKSGPQTANDASSLDSMTKSHLAVGFVTGFSF